LKPQTTYEHFSPGIKSNRCGNRNTYVERATKISSMRELASNVNEFEMNTKKTIRLVNEQGACKGKRLGKPSTVVHNNWYAHPIPETITMKHGTRPYH